MISAKSNYPPASGKSKWKKIFAGMLAVVVSIAALAAIASLLFEGKIKQEIVIQINEQVTVPVQVKGDINFSLLKHFPSASITFSQVSIDDKILKGSKKLIQVKEVSLLCNLISLFTNNIEFSQVVVRDGEINFFISESGKSNFDIFKSGKSASQSELSVELKKALIENVRFTYTDKAIATKADIGIKHILLKGDFSETRFGMDTKGKLHVNSIVSNKEEFLANRDVSAEATIDIDNVKQKYSFKKGKISFDESEFNVSGFFALLKEGMQLDFSLTNKGKDIRNLFALFPVSYKEELVHADGRGEYSISADVKGILNKTLLPQINLAASLRDSEIKLGKYNKLLKNVNASATYRINEKGKDQMVISNFNCTLNDLPFNFRLTLTDLSNPDFDFYSNGVLHLSEIAAFIPDSIVQEAEGTMRFNNFRLKGRKRDLTDITNSTLTGSGAFQMQEVEFRQNGITYGNINGLLKYEHRVIEAQGFTLNFLGTDFSFSGTIENLLPFVYNLSANRKSNYVVLGVNGKIKTQTFNLTAILDAYDKKNKPQQQQREKINIRDVFSMKGNMEVEIGRFLFRQMRFDNLQTLVQLSPGLIAVNRLNTSTMGGDLRSNGLISFTPDNSLNLKMDITALELDVSDIFSDCENFGQTTLTNKNLKGRISTAINMDATWKNYQELDENTLSAIVDFDIKNGELIKFEPLKAASKFIRVEELENIRFADIKNTIKISNRRIDIPDFEIKSSALNLMFFGYHFFDNVVDYHFKINLHKLLANKFKRNRKDDLYIENDPYEGVNIYLSMSGNLSNPVIKLDKGSAKNKMQNDFKNEKEVLKKLLTNSTTKTEDVQEKKYFDVKEQPQFMDFDTTDY